MAATVTIRASARARDTLNELAAADGRSVPDLLEDLAQRERDRRMLVDGLAALEAMDDATRDAYLGEWREWEDAPLDEPLP
jgi:hypothetical protein